MTFGTILTRERLVVLDEPPRTASGKIQKFQLRECVSCEQTQHVSHDKVGGPR